jgi:S1-C subfamily serine protease
MLELFTRIMILTATVLAPVPAEPLPDPLAWGYLGIRVEQGTLEVRGVEAGTPAERAGLRPGDEIVQIGELIPQTFEEVAEHISSFRPGSRLKVKVRRDGTMMTFIVRLGVRPADLPPPPIKNRPMLPVDEDD